MAIVNRIVTKIMINESNSNKHLQNNEIKIYQPTDLGINTEIKMISEKIIHFDKLITQDYNGNRSVIHIVIDRLNICS